MRILEMRFNYTTATIKVRLLTNDFNVKIAIKNDRR